VISETTGEMVLTHTVYSWN